MDDVYHIPVMLKESIDGLNVHKGGIYVDATFGGGGHTMEMLKRLNGQGMVYGFDQDLDALDNWKRRTDFKKYDDSFRFVRSNFRYMKNFMLYYGVEKVDGILADLGVSSHHFDDSQRGFSFRFEGKLDMRMNQQATITAEQVVNTYDERRLADIFFLYGEMKNSRQIAAAIVKARNNQPITTIEQLIEVTTPLFHKERQKKEMAKLFQALRIEVNQEMEALRELMDDTVEMLKPGGRLVVITYHSLEDRIVKNMMKTGNCEGREKKDFYGVPETPFRLVNRKVIVPSEEEQTANPRSRSAKLRMAELI